MYSIWLALAVLLTSLEAITSYSLVDSPIEPDFADSLHQTILQYDAFNSPVLALNEWDSSLYGKPVCVSIPANMSLCAGMNYDRMKMPNLLGHETIEEVSFSHEPTNMPILSLSLSLSLFFPLRHCLYFFFIFLHHLDCISIVCVEAIDFGQVPQIYAALLVLSIRTRLCRARAVAHLSMQVTM